MKLSVVAAAVLGLIHSALAMPAAERATHREDPAKYWNFSELSAAPKYRSCTVPDTLVDDMQELLVSGKGPKGANAEFFAYYAVPEGKMPEGGWPGLVLVHGGGGTAYPPCMREFVKRGFAVIALDWLNQMPATKRATKSDVPRIPLPGGQRQDHVANVANIVLAHSLLRSFPEVNPDRTVLAGLSWGSWYSGCVAAVDGRFRGAIAIYCCDFNPYRWYEVNGRFLHAAKIPIWWVISTNDQNVTPETSKDGFDECAKFAGCTIVNDLPHSHIGFEFPSVHRMAQYFVGAAKRLPKLGEIAFKDGVARAKIEDWGAERILTAKIAYTCDANAKTHLCKWHYAPAKIAGDEIVATVPPHTRQFYLAAYERESRFHDLCGTTKFYLMPPAAAWSAGDVDFAFSETAKLIRAREHKTGRELVTSAGTWVRVRTAEGKTESPATLTQDDEGRLVFGFASGDEIVERVTPFDAGLSFRVEKCTFAAPQEVVIANLCPTPTNYVGDMANAVSDDYYAICLRAGDLEGVMSVRPDCLQVSVSQGFSPVGKRAFLVGGRRTSFKDKLKRLVLETGLPHSEAGGPWSGDPSVTHRSYLFANLFAADVDTWIRVAKLGGVAMIHDYSWEQWLGHYDVNTDKFPRGLDDLVACADKIHAAGLGFSLHTLTGGIDYRDSWVTPKAHPDLIATYRYTLAEPVTPASREIVVNEKPGPLHDTVFTYSSNGNVLDLDGELVSYTGIRREKPYAFTGIARGWSKTAVGDHPAGGAVRYLQHRYFTFFPEPDSKLADELATRLAGVINATKADMFYLDGSEGMKTPYGTAKMGALVYEKVVAGRKGLPPVQVEMSSRQKHFWPFRAQFEAWDRARYSPKAFEDSHVASNDRGGRLSNFLEPQMGWWSPGEVSKDARGFFTDDVEYFASRNAGIDAAMSLQGVYPSGGTLPVATAKALALLGWYERFRLAKAFAPEVKARMAKAGCEGLLRQGDDGVWRYTPVEIFTRRVQGAGVGNRWSFTAASAGEAMLRIENFYGLERAESAAGIDIWNAKMLPDLKRATAKDVSFRAEAVDDPERGATVAIKAYNDSKAARGAWLRLERAISTPFADLSSSGGVGFWVKGDGSGAILNVRLTTPREHSNCQPDHLVKIDFKGWKYVELLYRERDTALADALVWEKPIDRGSYMNRLRAQYVSSVSVWLNEIPVSQGQGILDGNSDDRASRPPSVDIALGAIRALPLKAAEAEDVTVKLNGRKIEAPFDFEAGDYAELDDGVWTLYTERGVLKRRKPGERVTLAAGLNECRIKGEAEDVAAFRGQVTFVAKGEPRAALKDGAVGGGTPTLPMEYEPMVPQEYAPAKGAVALKPVAVRPGEKATLEITLRGPIVDPVLKVDDKAVRLPSVAANKVVVVRDDNVLTGTHAMSLASSAPQSADAVITISKCYVKQ